MAFIADANDTCVIRDLRFLIEGTRSYEAEFDHEA
jgi:hypothetical protein